MHRSKRQLRNERRAWIAALLTALAMSLIPTRWLVGWTSEVAQLVNVPMVVLKHPVSAVRAWLRPIPDPREAAPDMMRALESELDAARTLYKRIELENESLKERIARLERAVARPEAGDRVRAIDATVVGVTQPSARSTGSLTLNVGAWHGVTPGMVATWEGDMLVGRVADSVQRFTSLVIPAVGLNAFEVRFFPPDRDLPVAAAPKGLLTPGKDGLWTTDLTQPGDVAEGWIARLSDERWPAPARALRVGVVEQSGPRDDAPLMRRLVVRPLVPALRVPNVVLTDETEGPQ
ncbi:MAG: hypothetical protein SGJ11_05765 [Phycisphaerae bacterium]|nr:hypothetical protein [Phycisphaerae bacterium]